MNQNKGAAGRILAVLVAVVVFSLGAYFIGTEFLANSVLNDAQAAGRKIPQVQRWEYYWAWLVLFMGGVVGGILLLWTALSHWVLDASSSKRSVWLALLVIAAAACAALPYWYESNHSADFVTDNRIATLFIITHCILIYWGGSIITSSPKHKYTPFLAARVR